MVKALNNKEWKKFLKYCKEMDKKSTKNTLGVSFYTAELTLNKDGKIINVKSDY